MNVLSLFDGMSCGMIALDRLGIKVDNYYASEIDKYAIQVSQANYPDIVQVGDITKLDLSTLPKIDLVMGGSPCQGFSFAGKQLAFDDPRSALFFEFQKAISYLQPKYFLLENVKMKKEYLDIISEYMGVEPIFINSSLVSAQSRQRYYWTNIPNVEQPKERGIVLRDILEDQPSENPVKHTERNRRHLKQLDEKSLCMTATMYKGAGNNGMTLVPQKLVDDTNDLPKKSQTIKSQYYKSSKANFERSGTFHATGIPQKLVSDKPQRVGTHVEEVKVRKHEVDITALQYLLREMKAESKKTNRQIAEETNLPITKVEHWFRTDSSFAIPSDDVWLKLKEVLGIQTEVFDKPIMEFEYRDGVYESTQRVYGDHGKSPTLTASNSDQLIQTSDKPQHIGTAVDVNGHDILKRVYSPDGKSPTVNTMGGGNREPKVVVDVRAMTEVRTPEANKIRYEHKRKTGKDWSPRHMRHLVERPDEKMNTLTGALTKQHILQITKDPNQEVYWRKLTPLECERLQTVPDNYTNHVSNTQRYKMLGNGWTIEVIAHILKNMEV